MVKKKNCSGTRGYNCGNTCISVKRVCRKDGLAGQSVALLNNVVEMVAASKGKIEDLEKKHNVNITSESNVFTSYIVKNKDGKRQGRIWASNGRPGTTKPYLWDKQGQRDWQEAGSVDEALTSMLS